MLLKASIDRWSGVALSLQSTQLCNRTVHIWWNIARRPFSC